MMNQPLSQNCISIAILTNTKLILEDNIIIQNRILLQMNHTITAYTIHIHVYISRNKIQQTYKRYETQMVMNNMAMRRTFWP
jgi:hypothetical protein